MASIVAVILISIVLIAKAEISADDCGLRLEELMKENGNCSHWTHSTYFRTCQHWSIDGSLCYVNAKINFPVALNKK